MKRALLAATLLLCLALPALAEAQQCALPPDYDPEQRPDPDGTPTSVQLDLFVVDVTAINDADQKFTADLIVTMSWRDARLESLAGCSYEFVQIWEPRVLLANRRSISTTQPNRFTVREGGRVEYFQRGFGDLSVPLDLRDFPFDRQSLRFVAVSRTYGPQQLQLVAGHESGRAAAFIGSGWTFGQLGSENAVATPRGEELAAMVFSLPVERQSWYFIWKLMVPLTIVVAMAWVAQWIEPGMAPARIGMSSTAVLTVFAYQFSIANVLPRLSYMTRMDVFFVGATVIVFSGLLLAVLVVELNRHQKTDAARLVLRIARIGIPLTYVAVAWLAFG